MYTVYILLSSSDRKTYVGFTQDLNVRLKQHNSGKVMATRKRRPLEILFIEEVASLALAKERERYWKSGGGRRKLKKYFLYGFPPR